jgi:hypothetical protein
MGRKPIGRKAMTDAERQRRRRARLKPDPLRRVTALTKRFLDLAVFEKTAFLDWLRRHKFVK